MKQLMIIFFLAAINLACVKGQEFPFELKTLEDIVDMDIDGFNRFMHDSDWKLSDVGNESEEHLAFVEYGLPSRENINHFKVTLSLQYAKKLPSNRLQIDMYDTSFYDKILKEIITSEYRLIKNIKKSTDKHDDITQIYQNKKNSIICIIRDRAKVYADENGKYEPFYSYFISILSNSDFESNVSM